MNPLMYGRDPFVGENGNDIRNIDVGKTRRDKNEIKFNVFMSVDSANRKCIMAIYDILV